MPKLSARRVATLKTPGTYADGGGLYLRITPAGTKSWVFRYQLQGKRRNMGLGSVRTVSLAEARELASDAARLLRQGIDPLDARRRENDAARSTPSFESFARSCIEHWRCGWKNSKHAKQWISTLETYAFPIIGNKPLPEIDTEDVLHILRPIWSEKTETAHRVQGRIAKILSAAIAQGLRPHPNPAAWADHLANLLPAPKRVKPQRHHAALPWQEMPEFWRELEHQASISALALQWTILTAARTNETIGARWDEIDRKNAVWTIPADRMKSGRPHRVPLSSHALALLDKLPGDSTHLFPGQRRNPHISNMAMLLFLRRRGHKGLTVHGFRSSFRDWAAEATEFPRDLAEAALAHVIKDKAEAAYRRGDMLERRREMMQTWAEYLSFAT